MIDQSIMFIDYGNSDHCATLPTMNAIPCVPIVVLAAFVLAACNTRNPSQSSPVISGRYQLISVDGKPIPGQVSHGSAAIQVESGQMVFDAMGNCTSVTVFGPVGGASIVRKVHADYKIIGNSIDLAWQGAGQTRGTFGTNTFTMDNEGMMFHYKKE